MSEKQYSSPPPLSIELANSYQAKFMTDLGEFTVQLFAAETPKTVNNFIFLAREGFYDGVIFHRVIHSFMGQGGDQTGKGRGGPGYSLRMNSTPNFDTINPVSFRWQMPDRIPTVHNSSSRM